MCLYARSKILVAKKDKVVYKVIIDWGRYYITPFRHWRVRFNVKFKNVNLTPLDGRAYEDGYHSYTSMKAARVEARAQELWGDINAVICKAIIPKGASYVLGKDSDIVASTMKITNQRISKVK